MSDKLLEQVRQAQKKIKDEWPDWLNNTTKFQGKPKPKEVTVKNTLQEEVEKAKEKIENWPDWMKKTAKFQGSDRGEEPLAHLNQK